MRKIGKVWWNVGTNSNTYINVYLKHLSSFPVGYKIKTLDKSIYDEKNFLLISFGSKATLMQNIICWEALGFIKKITKNSFILIQTQLNYQKMIEISKINLLLPSYEKNVDRYKDSILLKIKSLIDPSFFENKEIYGIRGNTLIFMEKIKKFVGPYERSLIGDDVFVSIVKKIKGEK